jgi:hypothetical protein
VKKFKLNINTGDITVDFDFSENCIIQDYTKVFIGTMLRQFVHPFVPYYSQNKMTEKISFVRLCNT